MEPILGEHHFQRKIKRIAHSLVFCFLELCKCPLLSVVTTCDVYYILNTIPSWIFRACTSSEEAKEMYLCTWAHHMNHMVTMATLSVINS